MLLINDGQAEIMEDHIVLDEGVSADYDPDRAVPEAFMDRSSFRLGGGAYKQLATHPGGLQVFLYVRVMLLGKHLSGSHDACLVAVSDSYQSRQDSHHCLPGTDIALQQAVHLMTAHKIRMDLFYHSLLGACQLVRKGIKTGVEGRSDLGHRYTVIRPRTDIFLL